MLRSAPIWRQVSAQTMEEKITLPRRRSARYWSSAERWCRRRRTLWCLWAKRCRAHAPSLVKGENAISGVLQAYEKPIATEGFDQKMMCLVLRWRVVFNSFAACCAYIQIALRLILTFVANDKRTENVTFKTARRSFWNMSSPTCRHPRRESDESTVINIRGRYVNIFEWNFMRAKRLRFMTILLIYLSLSEPGKRECSSFNNTFILGTWILK